MGEVRPCCMFKTEALSKPIQLYPNKNAMKSTAMSEIRDLISSNTPVPGCSKCYHHESMSKDSYRLSVLEKYKNLFGKEFVLPVEEELIYLEIAFSNVCNNKCRMCNANFSTNWYSDTKKLNLPMPPKGVIRTNDIASSIDLKKLRIIKINGGEPLMEQDKIINLINRCQTENLIVILNTNASLLPNPKLISALAKCAKVEINLSIDAYGELNDFLRKGSNWDNVVDNLTWFYNNYETIRIHSTINIYNCNCYDKLIDFVKNQFPRIQHDFMMIWDMEWMKISNLPKKAKNQVREKNLDFKKKYTLPITDFVLNELNNQGDTNLFLSMDDKLNIIRNEHWMQYNKELYDWIH